MAHSDDKDGSKKPVGTDDTEAGSATSHSTDESDAAGGSQEATSADESAPVVTGAMTPDAADAASDADVEATVAGDDAQARDPNAGIITGTTVAGAGAAEPEDIAAAHHHDDDFIDDHVAGGSSFAGAALRFLVIVIVVFALSLWAVPMLAPHLPASIAQHIMPGQKALDMRLADLDAQVREQTAGALEDVGRMRKEVAELQGRVAEAEAAAEAARKEAAAARGAAEESAKAATSVTISEETVANAQKAVSEAEGAAVTATTAATEAGKVAASATRETASLARRMTSFEARIAALTEEMGAVGSALSQASGSEGGGSAASPEVAAAVAQLQAKLDTLDKRLGKDGDLLSAADADRFATQDDLRSSRVALSTEIKESIAKLPEPGTIVTEGEMTAALKELAGRLSSLEERIAAAETKASEASKTAEAASEASEAAEGKVSVAIRDASTRAATAKLSSQIEAGQPFAAALVELEELTGAEAPEELTAPAETGVATLETLRQRFGRRAQEAISASIRAEAADEGIFGKASARFRSVVAGRPKDERKGDDTGAIVSRIEARLREGALGDALEESQALPEPARAALSGWLDDLATRVAAEQAAARYIETVAREQG